MAKEKETKGKEKPENKESKAVRKKEKGKRTQPSKGSPPAQMPAGSPQAPGPVNNPANHPATSVPQATDPRWGEALQAMAQGGA